MQLSDVEKFIRELNDLETLDEKEELLTKRKDIIAFIADELAVTDKAKCEELIDRIANSFKSGNKGRAASIERLLRNEINRAENRRTRERIQQFSSVELDKLSGDGKGTVFFTPANLQKVLLHANEMKLVWDTFSNKAYLTKMPWQPRSEPITLPMANGDYDNVFYQYADNNNSVETKIALNQMFVKETSFPNLDEVVGNVAMADSRDFAKEWLLSHTDCGTVDLLGDPNTCLAVQLFKCEPSLLAAAWSRLFVMNLVWRILHPGCHTRYFFAVQSNQNIGKSEFCTHIVPPFWSTVGSFAEKNEEKLGELFNGHLVIELSEKGGMDRTSADFQKRFLTNNNYRYRIPWDKYPSTFPRRCVFFVSMNDIHFLNDPTGNTRCLAIQSMREENDYIVWKDAMPMLQQSIAQGLALYNKGVDQYLTKEEEALQREANAKLDIIDDSFEWEIVESYMAEDNGINFTAAKQDGVCIKQIFDWASERYGIPGSQAKNMRTLIRRALKKYGFSKSSDDTKHFPGVGSHRYFIWEKK
jgi:hypothetical protein